MDSKNKGGWFVIDSKANFEFKVQQMHIHIFIKDLKTVGQSGLTHWFSG